MLKFDHLALPVKDWAVSRDWYVNTLGMSVEFEIAERKTVAVRDQFDFTIFLNQATGPVAASGIALWFQVKDVDAGATREAHLRAALPATCGLEGRG